MSPLSLDRQYYYNSHSQQYMYWEGEKQTYVPAPQNNNNNTEQQTPAAAAAAPGDGGGNAAGPSDSPTPPGGKERKDKPKNKTAQQVSGVTRPDPPLGSRLSEWHVGLHVCALYSHRL